MRVSTARHGWMGTKRRPVASGAPVWVREYVAPDRFKSTDRRFLLGFGSAVSRIEVVPEPLGGVIFSHDGSPETLQGIPPQLPVPVKFTEMEPPVPST